MNTTRNSMVDERVQVEAEDRRSLLKELRVAEATEESLLRHLHRKYDQKGLLGLRRLKMRIADLRSRLKAADRSQKPSL